jgi:putative glycosyl hydrolase
LAAVAACFALSACGGGGGSQESSPPPSGGAPVLTPAPNPAPTPIPAPTPNPPPASPTTPTSPPDNSSTTKSAKRGIAYDLKDPNDLAALSAGVSWWYNYTLKPASTVPADYKNLYGMDYIPMLWNGNFNDAEVEAFLKANPSIKYLLLLNEPNLLDQSNQTPQQAAQLWPRYEAVADHTGVKLVGPAITYGTQPGFTDPIVWLDAFYAAYRSSHGGRDPHIDYLAYHWYDYGLNDQLQRLTKYGKPFWVTEFANWHSTKDGAQIDSVAKQKTQMTEMVAICENRGDVFRYAWFTGRWDDEANRHTSLLGDAGKLSELGQHYLAQPYWAAAWSAAPQSESASFNQQTLRQIVRAGLAGTTVRIKLSNALGTQPMVVSNVHVALRMSGSAIDTATDRAVTFGGQNSVSVPAGTEIYSDKVSLSVQKNADVAVSFYVPGATTITTGFSSDAQPATYVSTGNESGNADISVVSQSQGYHLLGAVEVLRVP